MTCNVGWILAAVTCATISAQPDDIVYPTEDEAQVAREVLTLLNKARDAAGVGELQGHINLDLMAYQHSREMADAGIVTHYSYRHRVGTETRVSWAFPRVSQFGENIAVNRSVEALHTGLQASDSHRITRLDQSFTHVGLGAVRVGRYQVFLTELFVRAVQPGLIDAIEILYTEASPGSLPEDQPKQGFVAGTTVHVGAPDSDNPAYWTHRGIMAYADERHADAIEDFRTALDLQPEYHFARYDLARALVADNQLAAAAEVLAEYLRSQPDDLDAWVTSGTTAILREDYEAAERVFRHVLRHRVRDAGTWYNLGLAMEMQQRLAGAESAYRQALHLDSSLSAIAAVALARIRR